MIGTPQGVPFSMPCLLNPPENLWKNAGKLWVPIVQGGPGGPQPVINGDMGPLPISRVITFHPTYPLIFGQFIGAP